MRVSRNECRVDAEIQGPLESQIIHFDERYFAVIRSHLGGGRSRAFSDKSGQHFSSQPNPTSWNGKWRVGYIGLNLSGAPADTGSFRQESTSFGSQFLRLRRSFCTMGFSPLPC